MIDKTDVINLFEVKNNYLIVGDVINDINSKEFYKVDLLYNENKDQQQVMDILNNMVDLAEITVIKMLDHDIYYKFKNSKLSISKVIDNAYILITGFTND